MNFRECAERIFLAGKKTVLPDRIICNHLVLDGNRLIGNQSFNIDDFKNIYVVGAGKATALMAQEVESILGHKLPKDMSL